MTGASDLTPWTTLTTRCGIPPDEGTYEMRDGWVLTSPRHDLNHEIIIDNAKAALRSAAVRADVKVRVITPPGSNPRRN